MWKLKMNSNSNASSAVRGVFKKFAAQPRRKTNFTTERGVRDVTLLKRSLTQPLPNRSCCFAQAVGCCKKKCYFVERSDARHGGVIRFVVLQKCRKGYPWRLVGNTGEYYLPYRSVKARIELFKAGRQSIEDDLHSGRPPAAVSEETWKKWVIW